MDRSEPPDNTHKLVARSLLRDSGWTLLSINWASQEFRDFCRYARSIEGLVDQAEKAELSGLEARAESLPERDREEFWAWNYPVHWDQVVRATFRASTVTAFVSFMETTLTRTADDVRTITHEVLKVNDLHGGQIHRCISYLQRFGAFEISEAVTQRIDDVVQVRNAQVHANGYLDDSGRSRRVRGMIGRVPGLTEESSRVFIGGEYIEHCLATGEELLSLLLEQTRMLWARRQRFARESS